MSVVHNIITSPIGDLTIVADDGKLSGLYQEGQSNYPPVTELGIRDINDVIAATTKQLREYFAGERSEFDLPLDDPDTEFKEAVLSATREVPYGDVCTYGDLADKIGKPRSTIYVAGALNANKISIVIPCHRVIGMKSTRYVADVEHKLYLQNLESSHREKLQPRKKGFLARIFG